MAETQLNIVELIENNPITKLSQKNYNVKLLTKIKSSFTDFEQQLFLSSFYCYLNHHPTNDFVIDLDNVWKWLGFSQKARAKELLEKQFVVEKDYIKPLSLERKHLSGPKGGGHNKETFLMNVKTFKALCLKAGTKKADEIHDYYLKLEEIIQEVVSEECFELKSLLEQKEQLIEVQQHKLENQQMQSEKEKEELKERTIIEQFPLNTQCIYIGKIENKAAVKPNSKEYGEILIKFGQSNNLAERVKCHKKTYENFRLYAAYKVKNKIEIENLIKKHPIMKKRLRQITVEDGLFHRELLALDDNEFTIEKVEDHIKEIIKQNEYNLENYNLLLSKVSEQENTIIELKRELESEKKRTDELSLKLNNCAGEGMSIKNMTNIASNYALCKYGYFLYAFQYEEMRFICSITRKKEFESLSRNLTQLYPQGIMKMHCVVSYPFSEKNMMFLLKQHCVGLGANKFESSFENIQKILNVATKLETVMTDNAKDLDRLLSILNGTCVTDEKESASTQEPIKRKAKRSVDQIHKDTGEVINVFESIEAAGRALGLTTGTAIGIALREKRVCQGFLWRYSGFSKGEQFNEQPIIKICCSTGEKTYFNTIADAARDANISAPALRNRVLTDIHCNDHHWIFQK
jgi:hypothetical protein